MLTCSHCGVQSDDVAAEIVYTGGKGYHWAKFCRDRDACWRRWNAANGVATIADSNSDVSIEEVA